MPQKLGKALRMIREAKGLPLREVAEKAGISTPYLGLIEVGQRSPSVVTIGKLSEALEVPVDFFLLMATGQPTGLTSTETIANRLVLIFERMEKIERELHDAIET